MPQSGRDVRCAGETEHADRQIPKRGHHLGACSLAHLRAILVEGDVANPVEAVLDRPVPTNDFEPLAGGCLVRGQTGDALDDLMAKQFPIQLVDGSFHLEDLTTVGEVYVLVEVGAAPGSPHGRWLHVQENLLSRQNPVGPTELMM